ncbi:MAG: hypothetical protein R3D26_00550 [Cyanobacteriota/Melainabacteria group bacterium]
METELRQILKERADEEAIKVFVNNLGELLMAPPLGQKAVLALDPGFRTGCKLVCLDRQGELLHHDVNIAIRRQRRRSGPGQSREDALIAKCGRGDSGGQWHRQPGDQGLCRVN